MTKAIPLRFVSVVAKVSDEDYERLSRYEWSLSPDGYAARYQNYRRIYMHHQVLMGSTDMLRDHIDGDRLNNTRNNLRFVPKSINDLNRKKTPKNGKTPQSKHVGVTRHGSSWLARVQYQGHIYRQTCATDDEAGDAVSNIRARLGLPPPRE